MPSEKRARQRANRQLGAQQAESARRSAQRRRSSTFFTIAAVVVALIVVVGAFVVSGGDDDSAGDATTTVASGDTATSSASTGSTAAGATTSSGGDTAAAAPCEPPATRPSFDAPPPLTIDPEQTYTATLSVGAGDVVGDIVIDLDAEAAPNTVNNFVFLANQGFYDCTTFHRIVQGFVVQGGDPTGTGSGGPGYSFADELPEESSGAYPTGSVAMANSGPDTQGSQFFIVTGDASNLPSDYTRFGEVVEGLDVAQALDQFGSPSSAGTPTQPVYLVDVTISP